ncbi:MAG: DMT family transporter [Desulfomonile tiedjei]|uniref:DMT family transporter n=1 Tax=Desulfomonile tiedjei TaxID=2358 RepID=A0A9D6Z5R9_9BACT|nr:DMT family transporter [Desulfomonile tiedjei]
MSMLGNIPISGVLLLLMLSFLWGGNMVSIKISNEGVSPILAAAIRSIFSLFFLWVYLRIQGHEVFFPREHRIHGLAIGLLFGAEFLILYWGIDYTDASRAVIFLYTHPFWVAAGAHFLLPGERMTLSKTFGLLIAFAGLVSVFGAKPASLKPLYWVGDLMEVGAALLWAATTVYIKKFVSNRQVTYYQTLFAQLFFSIPVLVAGSLIFEWGRPLEFTTPVLAALFYQTVIVATMSYVLWFWMIYHYQVSRLAAFTFLAPLFGVMLSCFILKESLSLLLVAGLSLVAVGIYLVNRPGS